MAFHHRYGARLNSFRQSSKADSSVLSLIKRAASVPGIAALDLNYPDHLQQASAPAIQSCLKENNVSLNGFAMRYYTESEFKRGAFTNPQAHIRRAAIDLTKRGIDELRAMGGTLMTLWMGNDGFDYPFQVDYRMLWDWSAAAIEEIAEHDPSINISIEYKPNEPRSFSLMPDVATTLLALREIAKPNLGVTLDFAHVLYADEMPAYAVALISKFSKLFGVHLNDGYGKRDDGLMAAAAHPTLTLELLLSLRQIGYDGILYFDTFPDISGLDPVAECAANIQTIEALSGVAARLLQDGRLEEARRNQDPVVAQRVLAEALYGAKRD